MARHPRVLMAAGAVSLVVTVTALVVAVAFSVSLMRGLPDPEAVRQIGVMDQATAVFDDQDQLAFTIYKEQRIDVPLSRVSPNLVRAVIAVEDQRFYDHAGFDVRRIASAALANVRHRRAAQGGSTITQQLARQSFLTPDKTLRRKLQELILARRLEHLYTKQQILELYLNKVYFGDGLYGIEAASRGYFGKHASELTVPEAALLAGLVKSPSSYAPTVSAQRAMARRNVVLQAMLDTGALSRADWERARATKLQLHDTLRADEPHGQYFKEAVRRALVDRFGWQRVYQGGLRVYSTIDMGAQIAAEDAVQASLKELDEKRIAIARRAAARMKQGGTAPPEEASADPLQAALVALDPRTGHVRAMVGGRSFDDSPFNRAIQARRQPGSAFKPFVYATALEAGYTPATVLDHLNDPIPTLEGGWTPEDEHSTTDSMTLRTALRTSSNRAAVQLLQRVGIKRTVQYARTMGVGDLPSVPSLALGSGEVTLASLATAYSAFANHGVVPDLTLIRRVEDRDGRVLYQPESQERRAISDITAFLMSSMMADVINAGTANRARRLGFTLPAAGKTGTTNEFDDAWFVGYTPSLLAGVWVGFDQPRTIMPNGFAADVAVPLWARFMKAATRGAKAEWLPAPSGITTAVVCRMSGKLATQGCSDVAVVTDDGLVERRSMEYTEYFARGTEPTTYCDLHPVQGIFGRLATLIGGESKPVPPRVEDTGLPPAAAAATAGSAPGVPPTAAQAQPEQQQKKKRGFWSRLFGRGKDEDTSEDKKQDKPQDPDRR